MVIKRVFNNNVAMVTSDDGAELIVIGRGLCFGRHAGDVVDSSSVEKTYALCEFTANDARALDRLSSLIETIPVINLAISEDIVEMLREELDVNVDDTILIALADHTPSLLTASARASPATTRCSSRSSSSTARSTGSPAARSRSSRITWAFR